MRAKPTLTFNGFSMHPLDALKNTAVLFEAGYLLATSNNHEYCEIGDTIVALATDYAFEVKNAIFYSRQDIAPEKQPEYMVNLSTQREACGLTTTELARLLDLDEEIILQWESGEFEPTISMLIPLANVLGCDPLSLLSEKNSESAIRVNTTEVHAESIGARIKSARTKLGLTESDLARMIHTYSDPINDWECGICEVPADHIVPLASALNCDLMWLLTGKSEAKEQQQ
ncbi:helix-turn-helix domain-containing protein [Escherichia coli]|uniref:helix-turn-helix domain-containing protein n=1 Tax=Escherichia coli TaxID=562 RepID=UPI000D157E81|nr:helix-turn-helix domain-containing protein [Escherichia coli]EEQ8868595.1 helix-turn-helix domain-containing protein [Escherichia coli]EER0906965.1 helix-turn-helix domain-containing protein [Escherichia coli]EEV4013683.1 helix-turn-helix domain-containing protein [Escherichia coli]EEV7470493.1 helix-turn-helix domain-containing protein [Escherichia coli]EEX5602654.1 helix-turn-helix domain-containing protein [Escherichia coli]